MLDNELLETLIENSKKNDSHLVWALVIMISVPVLIEVIKAIGSYSSKKKEFKNSRRLLIKQTCIVHQTAIFEKLDKLSLYEKANIADLIDEISEIRQKSRSLRIFLSKKQYHIINEILDYFITVCGDDFRSKNIQKENKLIQKYIDEFNS
jgi:hypothetical protein